MSEAQLPKRKRSNNKTNVHEPASKKQKLSLSSSDTDKNNEIILNEMLYQRSKITHLNHKHKLLLLGEGDFSFAASLSRLGFCDLVATSYQTYNAVIEQSYNAKYNVELIKRMKNKVFHGIDINTINRHDYFRSLQREASKFDVIIFNFPHCGLCNYQYKESIVGNQTLLRSIFEQSSNLLKTNGELHITLKSDPIYNSWDIQKQCKKVNNGFALKKRMKFDSSIYFGYQHKTTVNNKNVRCNSSFIWIFGKYFDGITHWKPIQLSVGIKFFVGMFKCKTCQMSFNSQQRYEMHKNSKKHNETHTKKSTKKKKKAKITASGKRRF